jgi:hypothetical protein
MVADMKNVTAPPAKRALRALDRPAPPAGEDLPKRISKKVRTGIDALVSGDCKTIVEAAAKAGLARESLSRALSQPHVARHLKEKVQRHLAIMAARAGFVKGELLDSANEMVRDRASSFVLGLAGIAPTDPNQRSGTGQLPGMQIVIVQGPGAADGRVVVAPQPATIDHEPAITE